ncbi:conserved protein of unknown function [Bradyrhizobium sp. ORS 285]|nr:conserved protein of unknown function [Bradyrhizobium sp. ORS 285]
MLVMAGLVPAIHVAPRPPNDVDARDKPGHDELGVGNCSTSIEPLHQACVSSFSRRNSRPSYQVKSPSLQRAQGRPDLD